MPISSRPGLFSLDQVTNLAFTAIPGTTNVITLNGLTIAPGQVLEYAFSIDQAGQPPSDTTLTLEIDDGNGAQPVGTYTLPFAIEAAQDFIYIKGTMFCDAAGLIRHGGIAATVPNGGGFGFVTAGGDSLAGAPTLPFLLRIGWENFGAADVSGFISGYVFKSNTA